MKSIQYIGVLFIFICIIGGIFLAKWLVPELPEEAIAAAIGGAVLGIGLVLAVSKIRAARKKDHTPEVDERTWNNMKNFYAISLYFVLIGSMAVVLMLVCFGHDTIELGAVSLYLLFLLMILLVGTFIVKRA
jgi:Ca2+/Na+ antiporter